MSGLSIKDLGWFCGCTKKKKKKETKKEEEEEEGRKELFYLMTHSTHFIYGYMASEIW